MVSATMSKGPAGPDDGALRSTFHVAPPPPPRPKTWVSELAIALTLALLFNILVIASFLLLAPEAPSRQEPPSISVELVQEPRPEPEPEPEPQPQPEPEQPPEEKAVPEPEGSGFFEDSGVGSDEPEAGTGGERLEDNNLRSTPVPEERTVTQRENRTPDEDIPGWAMNVGEGYDIPAGNPEAAGRERRASSGSGGGAYANAAKACIRRNFEFPAEAAGREGVAIIIIHVHRTGRILRAQMTKSAGVPALDRAALETIEKCSPLPPFPPGAPQDIEPFTLTMPMPIPPE